MVNRGQFNYQLLFARPGLTNEMITGANTLAGEEGGCHHSDQRGLTPNCENADSGRDLRDDDRCDFVGDNGLGLVVVDVDCLKGAHAKRLPAVGHPVDMDALKWRRYGNRLWRGTGSCTHAPQAAVNDIAADSETGSKHTRTHDTHGGVYLRSDKHLQTYQTCEKLFSCLTLPHLSEKCCFTDIIQGTHGCIFR